MADLIDPTQTGNYPVVLGDGLLGKTSNDIFTGVRYNHKPPQNDAGSGRNGRLKPSVQGQTSSYDMTLADKDNRNDYAFTGARNTSNDQYVLYFDPERRAFVLDRIDSTFNMNVTRMPGNNDAESLSMEYTHLDNIGLKNDAVAAKPKPAAPAPTKAKVRAKSPPPRKEKAVASKPKAKQEKQETKKAAPSLPVPPVALPQPKPKPQRKVEEEEEDEEEDDPFQIEYPGAEPKTQKRDFSPALTSIRRFDDFMDQRESEADDADGESESEPEMVDFKLPSPANHGNGAGTNGYQQSARHEPEPMDEDSEEDGGHAGHAGADDDDLEDDLEKDLEMAFEAVDNSYNGTPANVDESEISEED